MAAYDPRAYQMQAAAGISGMHPGVLANMNQQRFPRHGVNNPGNNALNQSSQSGTPARGGISTPDTKLKAGPGWENTFRTAQNIAFPDLKAACGERVGEFVEDLARGIGCPAEFIIVPLLPCIGGLLGTNTTVRVHRSWSEPPVVWSAVGASGGSRRSAVIRQLLAPILSLQAQHAKSEIAPSVSTLNNGTQKPVSEVNRCEDDDESGGANQKTVKSRSKNTICQKRALYSGTRITLAALTEVLHRNDGHAFSLTENVENLHEMLGLLQAVPTPRLISVMEDLYEGLPLVHVEDGRVTTILGSNFCHGGFASPEYTVTMMLKSPPWLSARLLLSCPQVDDMKRVFGELSPNSSPPELEQIYSLIWDHHQVQRTYTFEPEAVRELNNFFDEEWSTVLNQLDQNEHEGIVGKSMGQIVRLSGILKALDNSIYGAGLDKDSYTWDWVIDDETVKNAITLGKYFLEQKLAMTFMVGTGFFSHTSDNSFDGVVNENENATTLPHTALHDNMNYHSNSYSIPQTSASGTPKSMPVVGQPRSLSQDLGPIATPGNLSQELNSSNSQPSMPSTTGVSKQQGDVDFSNLPHTMTTVEEDVSEMMQAVDFVHFSKTQFVAVHGRRIKRLMECYDDGHGVSATTAAQKSITPPVRIEGTNNRHPAWASALFFQKVAELELGTAEQGRHPTNRKVCWRFKRKPISQLAEKDFQLLQYLRVEMDKYSQLGSGPFNPSAIVNSGLITLPQSNSPGPHQHLAGMSVGPSPLSTDMNEDSNSQSSPQNTGNVNIKSEVF